MPRSDPRSSRRLSSLQAYWLLSALTLGCGSDATSRHDPVVYGADGRTEVYAHPSGVHRAIAEQAIAIKIHEGWIDSSNPSDVRITYRRTLGEAQSLCAGQRFAEQIEPGTCSGTLVDDRHILTAGHCVDSAEDCTDNAWVLGFRYASAGTLAPLTINDVYRCASVVAYFDDDEVDHALVRLDRPVTGHTPAPVRAALLPVGTPLTLMGHPNGIPLKIDSGGAVTWSSPDGRWLTATLDAFAGNSGSGVFDTEGHVVAILRGGEDDYVWTGSCNVVNVIDSPSHGEALTYVGRAIDAFCRTGARSPLCGCEPPCSESLPGDRCADAEPITAASQTIRATLAEYAAHSRGSCGGEGPERSYTFALDRPARMIARAQGFDTVLYLRAGGCEGTERACNDDRDATDRGSLLDLRLEPGSYVLFLDAYDGSTGAFTLDLSFELEEDRPAEEDAGASQPDAGSNRTDAGSSQPDAGPSRPSDAGCGCSAPGPGPRSGALIVALLALGAWGRRRR